MLLALLSLSELAAAGAAFLLGAHGGVELAGFFFLCSWASFPFGLLAAALYEQVFCIFGWEQKRSASRCAGFAACNWFRAIALSSARIRDSFMAHAKPAQPP